MVRRIKALQQNAEFGENRPAHREHRSKKGRNRLFRASNGAFFEYKKKKQVQEQDFDTSSLQFLNNNFKI